MKPTLKCYGCKQEFRREELISYASAAATIQHNYCPACLKEKQNKEKFSDKICQIFGIKAPGARIWTERKRLINTYGYTDDIIIDCLDYIYNVEKKKKSVESICLVRPPMVEKMMHYKQNKEHKNNQLVMAAASMETKEYIVPIKENTKSNRNLMNADDFLD